MDIAYIYMPHIYNIIYISSIYMCLYLYVLTCVQLFANPWTVDRQAPVSMEFSRQEYWSGLPFPSPRDLPDPGLNLCLLHLLH